MCRVDYCDEHTTLLTSKQRRAAKPHRCNECGRGISVGETYLYESMRFDGSIDIHRTCAHCQQAREWLNRECGGFVYSQVGEEIREHAKEYFPQRHSRHLLRLDAGIKARWQRKRGGLWRVPVERIEGEGRE